MPKWPTRKSEKEERLIESKAVEATSVTSPELQPGEDIVREQGSVPAMTEQEREAAVAEYVRNQEAKLQQTLEKRKKAFAEKLQSQREVHAQVSARQLRINQLRQEIQDRREAVKKLRREIRELRPKKALKGDEDAA